jgi:hypothetical protein
VGKRKQTIFKKRWFDITSSERKKRRCPNKKKSANSNLVHNLRSKFDPHRHLRAEQVLLIHTNKYKKRMICGSDLAEWFERLTANAVVDTVESEGRQVKQS